MRGRSEPRLANLIDRQVHSSAVRLLVIGPPPSWVTWSNLLGAAWVLAFGAVILTSLTLPIEELLSVVWILAFGLAGAVVAFARRPRTASACPAA